MVRTDNNPLTYVLTTPNLDATVHRWVGTLASFEFSLEYQEGVDNGAADTLSQVPIKRDCVMVRSLLEGTIIGATDRGEAEANESLLCKHVRLVDEAREQAVRLVPMHVVDWQEAQEGDAALAMCIKWLKARKDTPAEQQDTQLKKYLDKQADTEEGWALFHLRNSLTMSKGLLYLSTTPKGELEGVLAFLVPSSQHTAALNGVHHAWVTKVSSKH